jgi:hypothetical protein
VPLSAGDIHGEQPCSHIRQRRRRIYPYLAPGRRSRDRCGARSLYLWMADRNGASDSTGILVVFLAALLLWLIGLAAIVLLFSRESAPFFALPPEPR